MFEVDSTTSWSRYRAALNAAQSKLVLTQDREDVSVRVRPARENVDGENTVVTVFEAALIAIASARVKRSNGSTNPNCCLSEKMA